MQTFVHIHCTTGTSLRERIAKDRQLEKHHLAVVREQQPGRAPGWMKLHSTRPGGRGAINVEWDSATATLTCRVVNRGGGKPHLIVADLIDYMLARNKGRVRTITIIPH